MALINRVAITVPNTHILTALIKQIIARMVQQITSTATTILTATIHKPIMKVRFWMTRTALLTQIVQIKLLPTSH